MRFSLRRAFAASLLAIAVSQTGCYAEEYRGKDGRAYRHERWHGEHVYQREDGRWYSRRGEVWEPRLEVRFE
jgi:hypothetical protein